MASACQSIEWEPPLVIRKSVLRNRDAKAGTVVHDAVVAEPLGRLTGRGVDRNEAGVDRSEKQLQPRLGPGPRGNATVREVTVSRVLGNFRIVRPFFLAGDGIQRDDAAERGGQIHHATDIERRRFEGGGAAARRLIRVTGAEGPGNLERPDVRPVDFIKR